MPTTGRPRAQARWSGPVSPATHRAILRVRAINWPSEGNDGFSPAAGGIRNLLRQRLLARPRIDQDAPAALQKAASNLRVTLDGPALCAPSGPGLMSTAELLELRGKTESAQASAAGSTGSQGAAGFQVVPGHG